MASTGKSKIARMHSPNGAIQPWPKGGPLLRYPFRFIHSRSRMLYGRPLSTRWGFDRGLPAHRYYINLFLQEFAADIKGRCLEFQDRTYLSQFADPRSTQQEVIHLDESNPIATIVADISQPNDIADDSFDCIVCTHVLHLIYDFGAAIAGLHRILKPGGVLLAAVPQISMCDEAEHEFWRFTRLGLEQALSKSFGPRQVATRVYGNSIVAAGELRGMIADEFTRSELNSHDACFAVEVCGRAVKSPRRLNGVRGMMCKCIGALLMMQEWIANCLPAV
jgi:SAM-dependent methyltransferase